MSSKVEMLVGPIMMWLGIVAIRRNFVPQRTNDQENTQKVSRSFWVGMIHGLAGTGGACTVALTLAASDAKTAV